MVIGQKKFTGVGNKLEKRIIEISGEKSLVRSFENGLKNFQVKKDYLISDNGLGKKIYTIYSSELKKGICETLKDFVRISGFGEEDFVVEIRESNFGNSSNFFNEKDRKDKDNKKNQITYSTDEEKFGSSVPRIRDLTAEEEQKLKDEGVEFIDSSQKEKLEKEKNEEIQHQKTKDDDNRGDKRYGGGSKLGIFFGLVGLVGLVGTVGAKIL